MAGISADFVSDGKYLKVTGIPGKCIEIRHGTGMYWGKMQIFRLEAMTQHLFTEPETDLGWRIQAVSSSFHWHVKRRRGRMIYSPCGFGYYGERQNNQFNDTSADDQSGDD